MEKLAFVVQCICLVVLLVCLVLEISSGRDLYHVICLFIGIEAAAEVYVQRGRNPKTVKINAILAVVCIVYFAIKLIIG